MKRRLIAGAATLAVVAAAAAPASADRGSPGSTFPEAPGGNVGQACASLTTNPGQGPGHMNPSTAGNITFDLFTDACGG
jgi:hypothetical protein